MEATQIKQEDILRGDKIYQAIRKSRLPGEPLKGLNEEDAAHIKLIASRLGVDLLNELEATAIWIKLMGSTAMDWLRNPGSFSVNTTGAGGKVRAVYVEPDELDPDCLYFAALHEMGHQALGHNTHGQHSMMDNNEGCKDNEEAAWEWAFSHANRWPNDNAICNMMDALSSYHDPEFTFRNGAVNNYASVNPCDRLLDLAKAVGGKMLNHIPDIEESRELFEKAERIRGTLGGLKQAA